MEQLAVFARALLLCAACGDDMDPQEQLAAHPSLQAAERDYIAFLSEARAAAEKVAPNVEWDTRDPGRTGDTVCGSPFDTVEDASSGNYFTGGVGEIPDQDWRAAADAVGGPTRRTGRLFGACHVR